MFKGACFALAFSSIAVATPFFIEGEAPDTKGLSWTPVPELSDEFNGNELDRTKWRTNPRNKHFSWIGRAPGLFTEDNVTLEDGSMHVEVGVLPEEAKHGRHTYKYYGAIVRSQQPGQVGYYYETRMRANATEMSSTFWLMTPRGTEKKLELDIQECVGVTSPKTHKWAKNWDQIFHSNVIHRVNHNNKNKNQQSRHKTTDVKNYERYFVYAAWWKSPEEIQFFLDGRYVYSVKPSITWDVPAFITMAIETYDWNPVPEDGGMIARGTKEQRTTSYDWVRVWKLQ